MRNPGADGLHLAKNPRVVTTWRYGESIPFLTQSSRWFFAPPQPCPLHLCALAVLELSPFTLTWESSLCLDPASGHVPCLLLGDCPVSVTNATEHHRILMSVLQPLVLPSTSQTSETATARTALEIRHGLPCGPWGSTGKWSCKSCKTHGRGLCLCRREGSLRNSPEGCPSDP